MCRWWDQWTVHGCHEQPTRVVYLEACKELGYTYLVRSCMVQDANKYNKLPTPRQRIGQHTPHPAETQSTHRLAGKEGGRDDQRTTTQMC